VASGRDVLHVLKLSADSGKDVNRLEEIRSVRISQHFQAPIQSTSTAGATQGQTQYPHLRDALRLPPSGGVGASGGPPPTAGGGGGVNVNVTDVAWSLPQSYYLLENINSSSLRSLDGTGVSGEGGNDFESFDLHHSGLLTPGAFESEQQYNVQHYPPFIKRTYMGSGQNCKIYNSEDTTTTIPVDDTSVVAAAGSNGVIVAWRARSALLGGDNAPSSNAGGRGWGLGGGGRSGNNDNTTGTSQVSSAASIGQPEAVFLGHARAINRLSWHPTGRRPYLLLSASQDGTVKLWDRRAAANTGFGTYVSPPVTNNPQMFQQSTKSPTLMSWFGRNTPKTSNTIMSSNATVRTASWHCVSTYQPKCEAVRDIKWNPFIDDVFAMVTDNGMLCVYDIRFNKPLLRENAHSGEATTVDWHPTRKYTIATGGGRDRSVKVWDLESGLNIHKNEESTNNIKSNSCSFRSENSGESLTITSHTSSEGVINSPIKTGYDTDSDYIPSNQNSVTQTSPMKKNSPGLVLSHSRHQKKPPLHVLSISAPVTRIRWRPPEDRNTAYDTNSDGSTERNHNESMIAVATSSIAGANAGGNGSVGLWSFYRPFMPISVVEGHRDGAVTDIGWVDKPTEPRPPFERANNVLPRESLSLRETIEGGAKNPSRALSPTFLSQESTHYRYNKTKPALDKSEEKLSQRHPQDIATEENISEGNAPSREWHTILTVGRDGQCLLQNFSLGERPIRHVPSSTFALANLSPFQPGFGSLQIMSIHQSVDAPGVLRGEEKSESFFETIPKSELVFSITDQGDAKDLSLSSPPDVVDVAPEVTHLSRFSELYATSKRSRLATKADVCRYNAHVAENLNPKITQMWKTLASILDGSGLDGLPSSCATPQNAMQYMLVPTIRKLLLQRANAGDVQTCVVLCEVMDIISPPANAGGVAKSKLPNLNIELIREWYLSYIDLLQQMCLFEQAASLIRNCNDPVIGALNQQSTSFHESCPLCGKPLMGASAIQDNAGSNHRTAQRVCRSCRGKIGMCFLCHEPVKGIFVWCPGCGHGGHLDHALEWFRTNETCPTGCGHKCNLFPSSSASQKNDGSRRN